MSQNIDLIAGQLPDFVIKMWNLFRKCSNLKGI
jgi:hypothetical protein